MKPLTKTIIAICTFSVAMAALESAVVVYLRALYYPEEFTVAFRLIDEKIVLVELAREIATLVMLGTVGFLSGRNLKERLAYFFLTFAVWDIFYYAWLKVFIDWPVSIFDWDILVLIPFAWLGPVLAPLICSLTMILLSLALLFSPKRVSRPVWFLLTAGSTFILYTFMRDYGWLIVGNGFLSDYAGILRNPDFISLASGYKPQPFQWWMFWLGELFILCGVGLQYGGFKGLFKQRPAW
ncbi:MAG TPA: hypothetical protein VF490_12445 [Chryseosolibacter sp.]